MPRPDQFETSDELQEDVSFPESDEEISGVSSEILEKIEGYLDRHEELKKAAEMRDIGNRIDVLMNTAEQLFSDVLELEDDGTLPWQLAELKGRVLEHKDFGQR